MHQLRTRENSPSCINPGQKGFASFFKPVVQTKLTINQPGDLYEQEADAVAEQVVQPEPASDTFFPPSIPFLQRKCADCAGEEKAPLKNAPILQRQESTETEEPDLSITASATASTSATGPDYLSMRRPFINRGVPFLWEPGSALQVWQYNFNYFRRFGLAPDLSVSLTNFTAPFFIDSQLKANNPTWWEITDRELNTSTFGASLPVLDFNADFSPVAPSWFRMVFGGGGVQRKKKQGGDSLARTENFVSHLWGGGEPLAEPDRLFFERRMAQDFSGVRVHTGSEASRSAESINALAYTHGEHIVFSDGQFNPGTKEGKRLMAHELTHVVQQRSGAAGNSAPVQRYDDPALWCQAFMELVRYEDAHGKLGVLTHYHSFSNEQLVPLNHNIPSIFGDVDVDWMFRLAFIQYPFIVGSIFSPAMAEGFGGIASRVGQIGLKGFWNTIRAPFPQWDWEYGSVVEEGNWNSSPAIVAWIHQDKSLREIFAPAIALCE